MSRESAIDIWRRLEAKGARVRYRPVTRADIEKAEAQLKVRLPPSYVELVTTLGAPAVLPRLPPGADPKRAENLDFTVLIPREIVKWTKELRRSLDPDMFEEPESLERVRKQLANAIFFQFGLDAGEGFVFLVDTADASGEMKVADYSHEYIEELDWGPESAVVFASLAAATANAATQVEDSWDEYCDRPA